MHLFIGVDVLICLSLQLINIDLHVLSTNAQFAFAGLQLEIIVFEECQVY